MKHVKTALNALEFLVQLFGICVLAFIVVRAIAGDWQVKAKLNVNEPVHVFCGRNFSDERGECKK